MVTAVALAADVFDELAFAELGEATLDRAQRNLGLGDNIRGVAARIRLNAEMNHVELLLRGNDGLPLGLRPGLSLRSLFPCCFGLASLKTLGDLVGNQATVLGSNVNVSGFFVHGIFFRDTSLPLHDQMY